MTDALTNIHSYKSLNEALLQAKQPKLFLIDIERFRTINLSFGDEGGDFVLQHFSKALLGFANSFKMELYRVKNDQFALLLEAAFELSLMEKIIMELCEITQNQHYAYEGKNISFNAHIGISFDHFNPLEKAYNALLVAKSQQQPFATYSEFANTLMNESKEEIHQSIQKAITSGKIILLFQAIVDAEHQVHYYESLLRFDSFDAMQSPMLFIKIAREKNVYTLLLSAIVKKILERLASHPSLSIGINLSSSDLLDTECFDFLRKELRGKNIYFEIHFDETLPTNSHLDALRILKSEGFSLVLDNMNSETLLEYFDKSSMDAIKLNGDVIRNLVLNQESKEQCLSILELAHAKEFQTIATHINAKNVLEIVQTLPFDFFQGYSFEKPHPL